tara:strand:- start:601 stop:945 length:345 start_codon:yes stop_codon:yes gene_type:complete
MPKRTLSNTPTPNSNYFEAIIQIRPENDEVINFILKRVEKREGVFISKIDPKKEGVDFYISSQRFATALGKKLKTAFKKGTLKITRSLFSKSRSTGKNIYRVTVLFRVEEKPKN